MIESTSSCTKASASKPNFSPQTRTIEERKVAPGIQCSWQPCFKPLCDALRLRHSTQAGGMLHHPLAFSDRELAEQEKAFARRGRNPVGVAAARIQKSRLRRPGGLLGKLDQFVFDLKRTQGLKSMSSSDVSIASCSPFRVIDANIMIKTMPQIVRNVFPTA